MPRFKVLREHHGDRAYRRGDIREADAHEVRHLIGRVLEPLADEKAERAAPKNKALGRAPSNKGD